MMIVSAATVALLLSDFLSPEVKPAAPEPRTEYADSGNGELLVTVDSGGVFGSIPQGASRVELARLNLSATCDHDVKIESIGVKHIGLGVSSDITSIYLADGFRRVSRARGFDTRSRIADLRVPSLVIPKCGAVRLSVLADFSRDAAAAGEHGVTVLSPADIRSTAKTVTLSTDEAATVTSTPDRAGNVTVTFLPVNQRLRYGRIETVARIQFTADRENDFLLKKITLKNEGNARDMDLINFRLETRSGEALSPVAQRMRGSFVALEFDPTYVLERGRTMVFLLKAEIRGSQSKKVNFTLEEPSDLETVLYRPRR